MNDQDKGIDCKYDISGIQIYPSFNLKWYKEYDAYSDGEVEERIIDIIIKNKPEDYSEAIYNDFSWPAYYHLTHIRQNILNWYPFEKDSAVLEIGCGLGAITNMLCEKCASVTSIELSKRRATAALLRCREQSNLEIIVGNINDITFEKKFDYITLIGVLEYQGTYTNSENPYQDFLKTISKLLTPKGKLLVAIENKYGAKYWCGAREDHTGIPFDGLNGYTIGNSNVRTFSHQELKELLEMSGYRNNFFYYPLPDYKLPTVIYSEKRLPKDKNMLNLEPAYVPDDTTLVMNEKKLYDDIIKNNVFEFFANSFLVESTFENYQEEKVEFALLSNRRIPEYRIGTIITNNNSVIKSSLTKDNYSHIRQTGENLQELQDRNLKTVFTSYEQGSLKMKFVDAPTMEECIVDYCKQNNKHGIFECIDKWKEQVEKSSNLVDAKENIIYELALDTYRDQNDYGKILEWGYTDMIPKNCFFKEETLIWFDQEWKLEKIPAKYILFLGLVELYYLYHELESFISINEMKERYELIECWNQFSNLRSLFLNTVIDTYELECEKDYHTINANNCVENIRKILNR